MHENLLKAQEMFIQHAGEVCSLFERDEEKGKIMALLYISEKPLTKKELTDKLKIKEDKINSELTKFLQKGVVREVKIKSSEEIHYEIVPDVVDVVMDNIKARFKKKIDMTLKSISESQELIGKCEGELESSERVVAKLLYERLERVRRINEIGRRILKGMMLRDVLDVDTSHIKKVDIS